jgi:hypothetical protein
VNIDHLRPLGPGIAPTLRLPDGAGSVVVALALGLPFGAVAVAHPEWWRGLLAAAVTIDLVLLGMRWPRAAVVGTLLWLPFVALIRRLLIDETGWVQNDPLLLVGPIVALFLCYRTFVVEGRSVAPDRLSKLVLLLLVIAFFGAFNPFGKGGLLGGLGGLIYLGVPLLWFFIGREIADRRTVTRVMYAVVVISVGIAAYGLYQTELGGMPQWDLDWFHITGFPGATAGTTNDGSIQFRPWGTFSSSSEYSGYLAMGLVFALAMLFHRRPALAIAIPLLALAVFLAGGRGVMSLTMLTGVVLTALRTRNRLIALMVVVLGIGAIYGAALTVGPRLDRAAGLSGDAKVNRQVGGLLSPLDPNESTFLLHWDAMLEGVEKGVRNPVGLGTGASNVGSRVSGGEGEFRTDNDVGDVFVALGAVGGIVFIAIIVMSFRTVFGRYLRRRPDPLIFAVAGILVVNFGQWLQGGHYAASALMWFLLGWAVKPTRQTLEREARSREVSLQSRLTRLALPWPARRPNASTSPRARHRTRSGRRPSSVRSAR